LNEAINMVDDIISKYIIDGSKNQINIGGDEKNTLLELQKKKKEVNLEDLIKGFDQIEQNIKRELESDSFKRFLRTKEANLLLKKYEKDETISKSMKQKFFPYSNKDFESSWILTEKDIQLLNTLLTDSFDYKISFIDLKTKKTGFYSYELEKFLPNYKEAKNSGIFKVECIFDCNVPTLFYECYPTSKFRPATLYEETIKKYSHDELIKINDELKEQCKLPPISTKNGKRSVLVTIQPMYLAKSLSFAPLLRSYFVSSLTFDPENEILTVYTKFCGEENQPLMKSSKAEFLIDGKKVIKKTSISHGFTIVQFKKINSNTTQINAIVIGKIS
jgi:hypothetical protein